MAGYFSDFLGDIEDLRGPDPDPYDKHPGKYFIVLGPDDQTLFYVWGESNIIPWKEVLHRAGEVHEAGGLQQDVTDISVYAGHVMFDAHPDEYKWGRIRTRYSLDVKRMVSELLRRGLISPTTPIKIGNWASQKGRSIGTARYVAGLLAVPQRLILYHGTTDMHWEDIQKLGLQSRPLAFRIWKDVGGKGGHPAHRDTAIYLTASLDTAAYYGEKAVRVLRARGYSGLSPVVLKITLTKRDFPKLRADDDYLLRQRWHGWVPQEDDWFDSLQEFGQVAFVGSIPAKQIERVVWERM